MPVHQDRLIPVQPFRWKRGRGGTLFSFGPALGRGYASRLRPIFLGGALLGLTAATGAQAPAPPDVYRWLASDPATQVAGDQTVVPLGMGAVFVPTMTDGESEPDALLFRGDDEEVASGRNGARIPVEPGTYLVRVGSGPTSQMVSVPVAVEAGETTVLPVRWGGLRVEVVDESNLPHRGGYELIRLADRQPYAIGFGADTLQGERLPTMLMPPGLYRIVRAGATYRARTDFATVLVPESGLVHYRLVIDPDSGRFRGAGVITPEEIGAVSDVSPWNRRYTIGLSAPVTATRNFFGVKNETKLGAELFFDTYVTYQRDNRLFSSVLEFESGFEKVKPEGVPAIPWRKTRDRLRIDLLYSWFPGSRIGPYGRLGLRTSVFASNTLATQDTVVSRQFIDGRRALEFVPANATFETGDPFSPPVYREGAGLNTRLLQGRSVRLDWRFGVGLRQNRFAGAFFLDDDPTTPELEYRQASNFNAAGLETTLVGTARYRFLLYNTTLDLFGDFNGSEPTIDWRSTLSWRLTGDLSLDYRVDLLRVPQVSRANQVAQRVLFRYAIGS